MIISVAEKILKIVHLKTSIRQRSAKKLEFPSQIPLKYTIKINLWTNTYNKAQVEDHEY